MLPVPSTVWHSKHTAISSAYSAVCSVSTATTAVCLLYYSLSGTSQHLDRVSGRGMSSQGHAVRGLCLAAGTVLLIFLSVWGTLLVISYRVSRYSAGADRGYRSKQAQSQPVHQASTCMACSLLLLWVVCLLMLLLSMLLEVSLTGLLWWNSHQLGMQYKVLGNCFCVVKAGDDDEEGVEDLLGTSCHESAGLSCPAVYGAAEVQMGQGLVMSTAYCQKLNGQGLQEECLHYLSFWSWFKVLRILLPIMILMKVPLMILSCFSMVSVMGRRRKVDEQPIISQYNSASGAVTLDSYPPPPSTLHVDPVEFYSNICAAMQDRNTHEQQRGGVGVQPVLVPEVAVFASKPVTLRSAAVMAPHASPPPLTVVSCPVPPPDTALDPLSRDDSPPGMQDYIISTPIEADKFTMTPQFDLSKVVKPTFNVATNEDVFVPMNNQVILNNVSDKFEFDLQRISGFSDREDAYMKCTPESSAMSVPPVTQASLYPPYKPPRTSSLSSQITQSARSKQDLTQFESIRHISSETSFHSALPILASSQSGTLLAAQSGSVERFQQFLLLPTPPPRTSSISRYSCPSRRKISAPVPTTLPAPVKPKRTSSLASYNDAVFNEPCMKKLPNPVKDLKSPGVPSGVQVVVEDASDSDYDSSTYGSSHSTTPIIRPPTPGQSKPSKAWPISPCPPLVQRGSSSSCVATMPGTDIREICRKARNISQSSSRDWSHLP